MPVHVVAGMVMAVIVASVVGQSPAHAVGARGAKSAMPHRKSVSYLTRTFTPMLSPKAPRYPQPLR